MGRPGRFFEREGTLGERNLQRAALRLSPALIPNTRAGIALDVPAALGPYVRPAIYAFKMSFGTTCHRDQGGDRQLGMKPPSSPRTVTRMWPMPGANGAVTSCWVMTGQGHLVPGRRQKREWTLSPTFRVFASKADGYVVAPRGGNRNWGVPATNTPLTRSHRLGYPKAVLPDFSENGTPGPEPLLIAKV